MTELGTYDIEEITQHLADRTYPISGISRLGTTEFHFSGPARYLGVALHSGSRVRPSLSGVMAVTGEERLREEDPYTDRFIRDFPVQLIARDSRFEYDLNWEIDRSIYPAGERKWGLQVWNRELTQGELEESYDKYLEFHSILDLVMETVMEKGSPVILFDMHSFCYQREGRIDWFRDERAEINLGTRYINREYFKPLIDTFLKGVSGAEIESYPIRVVENELFPGGYLTRKYSEKYNRDVLVMAIEYKKIFMDEWTGALDEQKLGILISNFLVTRDRILELL